jgi:hypothetical protein
MAAPASKVLPFPLPMRFGEVKHSLNPPAKAGGSFGYRLPNGLKNLKTASVSISSMDLLQTGAQ